MDDRIKFCTTYSDVQFHAHPDWHVVRVEISGTRTIRFNEVRDWLLHHTKGKAVVWTAPYVVGAPKTYNEVFEPMTDTNLYVMFEDGDEAVHFKMTW